MILLSEFPDEVLCDGLVEVWTSINLPRRRIVTIHIYNRDDAEQLPVFLNFVENILRDQNFYIVNITMTAFHPDREKATIIKIIATPFLSREISDYSLN